MMKAGSGKQRLMTLASVLAGLSALMSTDASAQIIGTIDGKTIVKETSKSSMKEFIDAFTADLKAQDIGDLLRPKSGIYHLRMTSSVTKVFLYIDAEERTYRWEVRSDVFKFSPDNLVDLVLKEMMKQGLLMQMNPPTNENWANVLTRELKSMGINPTIPGRRKICLKLGYQNCKLVIDTTEDDGLLLWSYKGEPFMKGNYAEAMLRVLQARGGLKSRDGKSDLAIVHGLGEPADKEEEKKAGAGPAVTAEAAKKPEMKPVATTPAVSQPAASSPTASAKAPAKAAAPVVASVQLEYDVASDFSDYDTETDGAIVVTGVAGGSGTGSGRGSNPFDAQGTGGGHGSGIGGNGNGGPGGTGTGNGSGTGSGTGNGTGIGVGGIKTSLAKGVQACNTVQRSGGHGTTTIPMNFGPNAGEVHIVFTTYQIPDEMIIRCNNHVVASTKGMVSGTRDLTFSYHPFGVGARANTCQIIVNGNEDKGTIWAFGASCPGGRFRGSF